ncbi:MAG TPA: hypothetical protein VMS08_02985 [Candidatus Saccharimonadia bacterium]|nr:hypothetical protein [Candidatus Saccharimonadia bacterium]
MAPSIPNHTDFIEYQPLIISGLAVDERFNGSKVYFVSLVSETSAKVWWDELPTFMPDVIRRDLCVPIENLRYCRRCPEEHGGSATCLRCRGARVIECEKTEQEFNLRMIHPHHMKKFLRLVREKGYRTPA